METKEAYKDFQARFKLLADKRPQLILNTLSNIFTMRLIGNKTHGDMAEIGIAEFIQQFMYDFDSRHVGKDLFRAKEHEEDIVIINEMTKVEIPVSLKAYGDGPLQLSTDKDSLIFPLLKKYGKDITSLVTIREILWSKELSHLDNINVMPLIYREKAKTCNIMIFDFDKMKGSTSRILYVDKGFQYNEETQSLESGGGRKHPIYIFLDKDGKYICEVRYGNASANALQRGLWTNTQKAPDYFNSLTNGWINYEFKEDLVKLFRLALNSSQSGHTKAIDVLQKDINRLKEEC